MTRYKHYPYHSWIKWIIKPRQSHMVDSLERRPEAFEGTKGEELAERLRLIKVWLRVRAALIVLLSFSVVVTAVTWTFRVLGDVPGGGVVMTAVEMASNITSATSGVLGLLYVFTLRTLGQLEMDAILLFPSHRSHWGDDDKADHEPAATSTRSPRASVRSSPRRAQH